MGAQVHYRQPALAPRSSRERASERESQARKKREKGEELSFQLTHTTQPHTHVASRSLPPPQRPRARKLALASRHRVRSQAAEPNHPTYCATSSEVMVRPPTLPAHCRQRCSTCRVVYLFLHNPCHWGPAAHGSLCYTRALALEQLRRSL